MLEMTRSVCQCIVLCILHGHCLFFAPFWHMLGRKPWIPATCPHLPKRCYARTACNSQKQKVRLKQVKDIEKAQHEMELEPKAEFSPLPVQPQRAASSHNHSHRHRRRWNRNQKPNFPVTSDQTTILGLSNCHFVILSLGHLGVGAGRSFNFHSGTVGGVPVDPLPPSPLRSNSPDNQGSGEPFFVWANFFLPRLRRTYNRVLWSLHLYYFFRWFQTPCPSVP